MLSFVCILNKILSFKSCFLTWLCFTGSEPSLCVCVCITGLLSSLGVPDSWRLVSVVSESCSDTAPKYKHNVDFLFVAHHSFCLQTSNNGINNQYTYKLCESFGREQLPTHSVPVEKTENTVKSDTKVQLLVLS